jgi:ABC-2 type transport system ATP-binding protein
MKRINGGFENVLKVDRVIRRFGRVTAVDDVSFEIQPGEMVGFLGPNGSGKTTLLRVISTYLLPSSGTVLLDGLDVRRSPEEVRRRIGYLPESNILYPRMRVWDYLKFAGEMRGLCGKTLMERIDSFVQALQLESVLEKRNGECSKGFRQRISMAAVLLHRPPVILLDEPTIGLDPLQLFMVRDFLRELAKDRIVLFSSHIMQEVAAMTQRVLLIHQGKLIRDAVLPEDSDGARQLENMFKEALV